MPKSGYRSKARYNNMNSTLRSMSSRGQARSRDEYQIGESSRSRDGGSGCQGSRSRKRRRRKSRTSVIVARTIFCLVVLAVVGLVIYGGYRIYGAIAGRARSDVDVTTVTVAKNGTIRETIVEEFNPGFYDEGSLKSDIEGKISAAGGKVESEGLEIADGVARLKLKYESDDEMAAFNDEVFYADTIDSLISQGVSFDSEAVKAGGTHAVIVSETMDIRVPKKIIYVDGAITIDSDDAKLAHCTVDDGDLAFLIY